MAGIALGYQPLLPVMGPRPRAVALAPSLPRLHSVIIWCNLRLCCFSLAGLLPCGVQPVASALSQLIIVVIENVTRQYR